LHQEDVPDLTVAFGLGSDGRLSDGPVARGRVGAIWRLDTPGGSWAVKEVSDDAEIKRAELLEGAAFQEAAALAGVPVPLVRRTIDGELIARVGETSARVFAWVDLEPADVRLEPAALGSVVARLHRVPFAGQTGTDDWYLRPMGERRWRAVIAALRERRASFTDELEPLVLELIALEALVDGQTHLQRLRTCHRDLWADNLRARSDGGLCVFDFDNAGLADPSQELAMVLVEYQGDADGRARAIREAYADAGGPADVHEPRDFAMVIATLAHIVDEGCRRWLVATTEADRADNEAWVREFVDRPLTREVIDRCLA
jgi:Ser/Thr protein kinase RdoA (MazF antagonist)